MTRELLEGELSWADSFVKDLLTEEEKYQDVLKTLSDDVIIDVIKQLDVTSEEFQTGADILGERAMGSLYRGSDETSGGTYDIIIPSIITLTPPPKGVDDELDQAHFDFDRELDRLAAEYNAELDERQAEFLGINEKYWRSVDIDIGKMQEGLDTIQRDLPGFVAEETAGLLAIPFSFLFDRFIDFFFEEEN